MNDHNMDVQQSVARTDDTELWRTLVSVAFSGEHLTEANLTLVTNCLVELRLPPAQSSNPKLCVLLLMLQRLDLFESILDAGVTDLWLPLPKRLVRRWLTDDDTKSFLSNQKLYLDESIPVRIHGRHFSLSDADDMGFQRLNQLGVGGFGEVHRVRDRRSGQTYACKTMVRPNMYSRHRELMLNFGKELAGMRRVHHRHCVTFVASCTDMDSVVLLSWPVADMDLATFLQMDLTPPQLLLLKRAIGCITSALVYLHHLDIRHDDLKPNNILIHGDNILLTDFGFCLDSSDSGISTTVGAPKHLSRRYSAPEVFDHAPRSRLSDIWSLGCVLCDIVSRLHHFTPQHMKSFWTTNGTKYDSYAENTDATAAWLDRLYRTCVDHDLRWLCSFIKAILLEQERLLRPTAKQVLRQMQLKGWIGDCCRTTPAEPNNRGLLIKTPASGVHLLDLLGIDSGLACVFVDTDLKIMASSDSTESNLILSDFMLSHDGYSVSMFARTILHENGRSPPKHCKGQGDSTFAELVKSLYIATEYQSGPCCPQVQLPWWTSARTCIALLGLTVQLERHAMYGEPILVLLFPPDERNNVHLIPDFTGHEQSWARLEAGHQSTQESIPGASSASYSSPSRSQYPDRYSMDSVFDPLTSSPLPLTRSGSVILRDIDSPYRPVRAVTTQLVPPPSSSGTSRISSVPNRQVNFTTTAGTAPAHGISWDNVSVGDWIRDDIMMAGISPAATNTGPSPSAHSSLDLPKMERAFMKDFNCCGLTLPSLHDLLQHFEEKHANAPPAQNMQPA